MKAKTYNKLVKIAEIDMRKYENDISLRLQKQYIRYHVLGLQVRFMILLLAK